MLPLRREQLGCFGGSLPSNDPCPGPPTRPLMWCGWITNRVGQRHRLGSSRGGTRAFDLLQRNRDCQSVWGMELPRGRACVRTPSAQLPHGDAWDKGPCNAPPAPPKPLAPHTQGPAPAHTPSPARAYTQDDGIFRPPALRWGLVAVDSPLGLGTGQSGSSASWWGREGSPHPRACSCMRPPAQPNPTPPKPLTVSHSYACPFGPCPFPLPSPGCRLLATSQPNPTLPNAVPAFGDDEEGAA